jgi:hypothetical protein
VLLGVNDGSSIGEFCGVGVVSGMLRALVMIGTIDVRRGPLRL